MRLSFLPAALVLASASLPVLAADLSAPAAVPVPPPMADAAKYQLTLYGWATALTGHTGVRGWPAANVDISAIDALSNLDGAVMGSFMVKKSDFTFLMDVVYANLSASSTVGRDGASYASLGIKQAIVSGLLGYRLPVGLPQNVDLSATVGFRYQHLSGDFQLQTPLFGLPLSTSGNQDWVDPTIGLMLNYAITEKWFLNVIGDVGGFGLGSKITAQGFASVGYMWTPNLSTAVGYRAIYTDYVNNGFVYDMTQHGVFLSAGYHF